MARGCSPGAVAVGGIAKEEGRAEGGPGLSPQELRTGGAAADEGGGTVEEGLEGRTGAKSSGEALKDCCRRGAGEAASPGLAAGCRGSPHNSKKQISCMKTRRCALGSFSEIRGRQFHKWGFHKKGQLAGEPSPPAAVGHRSATCRTAPEALTTTQ